MIVYKYRDWQDCYHRNILLDNQLYLASPKDFNDPFDCRINQNFKLLSEQEEKDYINELCIKGFEESEKRGKDFKVVIRDFEKRFNRKAEFQKYADDLKFEAQDQYYAIFSCSLRWNSILMWSHYARNHTGFCVGFYAEKLKESRLFGKLGDVKYQDSFPEIKPRVAKKDDTMMLNSFIETHTKAEDWQYEKEYRFMFSQYPKILTLEDRIKRIPDDFFAEVILGIYIDPVHKRDIIAICKKKNIPLYQAKKKDFKFEMDRDKIE